MLNSLLMPSIRAIASGGGDSVEEMGLPARKMQRKAALIAVFDKCKHSSH